MNRVSLFLFASALLFLNIPLLSGQALPKREMMTPAAPGVPEYAVFAGDTIWLDTPARRERMDRELLSFTNMHTTSILMLKRSERYFTMVVPILKEQGIPEDFKYMMAIESSLDPKAVSKAGAAGLWQFTKATAQTYKLEVNDAVDERYHIEKETVAACQFLKDAYAKFGDWMTVAASYNAGQKRLEDSIALQGEPSGLELWLPEETMRYLYRLMTAKLFFEHPEAFGFNVPRAERYPYIPPSGRVVVNTTIPDLAAFAREQGTTYARLKEANLWLRSTSLPDKSGKTYVILLL